MALSILDGNQSATTLSTILSSGQHITAHTVVSLGTQAITDMRSAVSGSVVSVSSLPAISGTVTVGVLPDLTTSTDFEQAGVQIAAGINSYGSIPVAISAGTVTIGSALPAGTNRIGVVTIGGGSVTIGAGTAQIGSVTASISNSLTISSLPAISGTVTGNINDPTGIVIATQITDALFASDSLLATLTNLPISGTVTANTFAVQGTAVTTSNFTSTTASTVLANFNATREVLTIFNEGAGNLHICAGATCTTIAYQVRLSAGDYYEVPNHQTSLTHSAVFATAGTARIVQIS